MTDVTVALTVVALLTACGAREPSPTLGAGIHPPSVPHTLPAELRFL